MCLWPLLFQGEYGVTWRQSESSPYLEPNQLPSAWGRAALAKHRHVSQKNRWMPLSFEVVCYTALLWLIHSSTLGLELREEVHVEETIW